jgi:signal transduction histidine kinase
MPEHTEPASPAQVPGGVAEVLAAQEHERARVARDLHDQVGQSLTSALLALRLAEVALDDPRPDLPGVRRHLGDVRELLTDALRDVRELAFDLRPPVLDDLGLPAALERLTASVGERNDLEVTLDVDGFDGAARLPGAVETASYRVVQEALTNVVRHAHASSSRVSVARGRDRLRVTVDDDCVGFTPDPDAASALGLRGMHERAALAGGWLRIDSRPGAGTAVLLEVPL